MRIQSLLCAALLLFVASCTGSDPETRERQNRNVLTRAELAAADRATAYDAVTLLRPQWLQRRGRKSLTQPDDYIVVYLNDTRYGPPETLREISLPSVEFMQFISAGTAHYRFGAGHSHGAILVRIQ